MPDKYRVAVVLCELEGQTLEEAARHLGCPLGTVASRLKVNVPVELVVLEGAGHGGPEFANEESRKRIEAFFIKHLRRAAPK